MPLGLMNGCDMEISKPRSPPSKTCSGHALRDLRTTNAPSDSRSDQEPPQAPATPRCPVPLECCLNSRSKHSLQTPGTMRGDKSHESAKCRGGNEKPRRTNTSESATPCKKFWSGRRRPCLFYALRETQSRSRNLRPHMPEGVQTGTLRRMSRRGQSRRLHPTPRRLTRVAGELTRDLSIILWPCCRS